MSATTITLKIKYSKDDQKKRSKEKCYSCETKEGCMPIEDVYTIQCPECQSDCELEDEIGNCNSISFGTRIVCSKCHWSILLNLN